MWQLAISKTVKDRCSYRQTIRKIWHIEQCHHVMTLSDVWRSFQFLVSYNLRCISPRTQSLIHWKSYMYSYVNCPVCIEWLFKTTCCHLLCLSLLPCCSCAGAVSLWVMMMMMSGFVNSPQTRPLISQTGGPSDVEWMSEGRELWFSELLVNWSHPSVCPSTKYVNCDKTKVHS